MILYCKNCNLKISQEVVKLQDHQRLTFADGHDYLPKGFYHIPDSSDIVVQGVGEIMLNLKDLMHTKLHPDSGRLNGCCGLDGMDGLNIVCDNGHEIGTECSDCWMPHYIHIPQDNVRRKQ